MGPAWLNRIAKIVGTALALAGLGLSAYAYFAVREPLPSQVQAISNTNQLPVPSEAAPTSTASQNPAFAVYPKTPHLGARVGTVTLPSLSLSWPIYQGTTATQLAKGVGHYVQSVLPGQKDNTVLSGHRTTVFNRLGELKRGQSILVKTSAGTFTYVIRSFRMVLRTDRTVIVHTNRAVLTLTTCYPFNNIGATTKAFIVSADLIP